MARGRGHSLVRYRTNNFVSNNLRYGRKVISDYGDITYEDRLVLDDYGNTLDPRKHAPDIDYSRPEGRGR